MSRGEAKTTMLEHLLAGLAILLIVVSLDMALAGGHQPPERLQRQYTAAENDTIQKAVAWRDDKRCAVM